MKCFVVNNNSVMKLINLSILLLFQILFFSCSEQGVYVNSTSNQVVKKDTVVTRAINRLTPGCSLLAEIDKNVQDTVLKRLELNIARNGYSHRKGLSLPLVNSTVKFVPVVDSPMPLSTIDDSDKILVPQKDFTCFYGQNEKGETIYFYAIYKDRSNFTKETNPRMYKMNVELFGQEYADKEVEKLRNARGPERWEIIVASPQDGIGYKKFEYARKHSDDGSFFILTRGKTYPHVCFFMNKKPYYCCEIQQELGMEPLENRLKR